MHSAGSDVVALEPRNPKLWQTITVLARSKFHPYPSPAASHWVHKSYEEKGGLFVDSSKNKRENTGRRR